MTYVETGQIWTWGDGANDKLGRAQDPTSKQTPKPVTLQIDLEDRTHVTTLRAFFVKVACGLHHTVAITGMEEWMGGGGVGVNLLTLLRLSF